MLSQPSATALGIFDVTPAVVVLILSSVPHVAAYFLPPMVPSAYQRAYMLLLESGKIVGYTKLLETAEPMRSATDPQEETSSTFEDLTAQTLYVPGPAPQFEATQRLPFESREMNPILAGTFVDPPSGTVPSGPHVMIPPLIVPRRASKLLSFPPVSPTAYTIFVAPPSSNQTEALS